MTSRTDSLVRRSTEHNDGLPQSLSEKGLNGTVRSDCEYLKRSNGTLVFLKQIREDTGRLAFMETDEEPDGELSNDEPLTSCTFWPLKRNNAHVPIRWRVTVHDNDPEAGPSSYSLPHQCRDVSRPRNGPEIADETADDARDYDHSSVSEDGTIYRLYSVRGEELKWHEDADLTLRCTKAHHEHSYCPPKRKSRHIYIADWVACSEVGPPTEEKSSHDAGRSFAKSPLVVPDGS